MVKTISLKCPECGAELSVEEDRKQCFCQYCGSKILIDDGSTSHVYRKVDEARIKEAEVRELLRLKELELEEKKQAAKAETRKLRIKWSIILAIIGVALMMIGFIVMDVTDDPDSPIGILAIIGMFCLMGIAAIWMSASNDNKK